MVFTISDAAASAAGGALGAALGALLAFSLMGGVCLVATSVGVATGTTSLIGAVALGPVLGPHVAFAGGVAAAAYAAHRGLLESGRDIVAPLAGLGRIRVLAVGAVFGVLGQFVHVVIGSVASVGGGTVALTDSIALSVVVTAVLAHLLWGRPDAAVRQPWLPYQHTAVQVATIGVAFGAAAGWLLSAWPADARGVAPLFLYGISALSLVAFQSARSVPVTHHVTLPAGLAALAVLDLGSTGMPVIAAAVGAGLLGALSAEVWARTIMGRSRIHIDPPAFAIALCATILAVLTLVVGS